MNLRSAGEPYLRGNVSLLKFIQVPGGVPVDHGQFGDSATTRRLAMLAPMAARSAGEMRCAASGSRVPFSVSMWLA